MRFQDPVIAVTDLGIGGKFRQIPAYQSKVMACIKLPDSANPLQCRLVTNVTTHGITRIGRIYHHTSGIDGFSRALEQAWLRMGRMDFDVLAHKAAQSNTGPDTLEICAFTRSNRMITTLKTPARPIAH